MTILNFTGWERGDGTDCHSLGGTPSYQTTIKRTGSKALRINAAASAGHYAGLGIYDANGRPQAINRTAETFYTKWFRFEDIPSGTVSFGYVASTTTTFVLILKCDSSGNITLVGATTSATIATISADTWFRVDIRCTSNGTSGAKINGGTEQTCTANNLTQNWFACGRQVTTEAVAFDCYYDDVFISDSAFPADDGGVYQILPNGTGNYTGWTQGTANSHTEVDDDPSNDADTTYIRTDATGDNTARTFTMQDRSTVGIVGDIVALKLHTICRSESISGTSAAGIRLRSNTTDSDSTAIEWVASYTTVRSYCKLYPTDPATGAAWTGSAVDAVEGGVYANTLAQSQRCTSVSIQVWCTNVSGITADVPVALVDFAGIAPTTKKSTTPPIALTELLGVAITPVKTVTSSPALVDLLSVAPSTQKSASPPVVLVDLINTPISFGPQSVDVAAGVVHLLAASVDTPRSAPVPAALLDFLPLAPDTDKVAPVAVVSYEHTAPTITTVITAALSSALLDLIVPPLEEAAGVSVESALVDITPLVPSPIKTAALPPVVLELTPLEPTIDHSSPISPAIVDFAAPTIGTAKTSAITLGIVEFTAPLMPTVLIANLTPALVDLVGVPSDTQHSQPVGIGLVTFSAFALNELLRFRRRYIIGITTSPTVANRASQVPVIVYQGTQIPTIADQVTQRRHVVNHDNPVLEVE